MAFIFGTPLANNLMGTDDNDLLKGYEGNDTLRGGLGADTLNGGEGLNSLDGGDGDDLFVLTTGSQNVIVGGTGFDAIDQLNLSNFTTVININLNDATTWSPTYGVVSTVSVEAIREIRSGSANDVIIVDPGFTGYNYTIYGNDGNDFLFGGDVAIGQFGNIFGGDDFLSGGAGDDLIGGASGEDSILGGTGNDVIDGSDGSDLIAGGTGNDDIDGGNDIDILRGEDGDDTLNGGADNDQIYGGLGINSLVGGLGNDLFYLSGSNRIDGGDGIDVITYLASNSVANLNINLNNQATWTGLVGLTSVTGVEALQNFSSGAGNDIITVNSLFSNGYNTLNYAVDGNGGNDSITGGNAYFSQFGTAYGGDDILYGEDGNDTIRGLGGEDILVGGTGNDVLDGGDGQDTLDGKAGNDNAAGGFGDDLIRGEDGNDTLSGGGGNDVINGGLGINTLNGDLGEDRFYLSGSNVVNGGDGIDVITYLSSNSVANLNINLNNQATWTGLVGLTSVTGVEALQNFSSGAGNDIITVNSLFLNGINTLNYTVDGNGGNDSITGGNAYFSQFGTAYGGDDILYGEDGNDTIRGLGGEDILVGGTGNDLLDGGFGDDFIRGEDGNDTLSGGGGNDVINGGLGINTLNGDLGEDRFYLSGSNVVNGGDGIDVITYLSSNSVANLNINLNNQATWTGLVGLTSVTGVEALQNFSSGAGNDIITVNSLFLNGINTLNYTVDGNGGNDSITGGNAYFSQFGTAYGGDDILYGEDGNDTIRGLGGEDILVGGTGNDLLDGGLGDDFIRGEDGNDTLSGGGGNDVINGGLGINTLNGDLGEDRFYLSGSNVVNGGDGIDVITYLSSNSVANLNINLNNQATWTGLVGLTSVTGVEALQNFSSGAGNDIITVNSLFLNGINTLNYTVDGNGGNDSITGGNAYFSQFGTAYGGDDILSGGEDNDTIRGLGGNDRIFGDTGNDSIIGDDGRDTASGGSGNDLLNGGDGDDVVNGGSGTNTLVGGNGDDIFNIQSGSRNVIHGSDGVDVVAQLDVSRSLIALNINLNRSSTWKVVTDVISAVDVEAVHNFYGGYSNDVITVDPDWVNGFTTLSYTIYGNGGNDSITGGNAYLSQFGNTFGGADTLVGGDGNDTIVGLGGNDDIYGDAGNDSLVGSSGQDSLRGGTGVNILDGGEDDDVFFLTVGSANYLRGGDGFDIISELDVSALTTAVNINLNNQSTWLGKPGISSVVGLEAISKFVSGNGSDVISIDPNLTQGAATLSYVIYGNGGNDSISGGNAYLSQFGNTFGGADILVGGDGNDTIVGLGGNDNIYGDAGNDSLVGSSGQDSLRGGTGVNVLDGGEDNDIFFLTVGSANYLRGGDGFDIISELDVSALTTTVNINLNNQSTWLGKPGISSVVGLEAISKFVSGNGSDVISVDPNITQGAATLSYTIYGNGGNDSITGGNAYLSQFGNTFGGADTLVGGDGNDTIVGLGGNDNIYGGTGVNVLDGGEDNDIFFLTVGLVVQKTPEQPAGQEFRPFLRVWWHERSTFERSGSTLGYLKPSIFV